MIVFAKMEGSFKGKDGERNGICWYKGTCDEFVFIQEFSVILVPHPAIFKDHEGNLFEGKVFVLI